MGNIFTLVKVGVWGMKQRSGYVTAWHTMAYPPVEHTIIWAWHTNSGLSDHYRTYPSTQLVD